MKGSIKYVLLSDVVGSRKIKERKKFEKKLSEAVQQLNLQYSHVFELPMKVWKGIDEMAAIVKQPWLLYEVMTAIDNSIAPYQMRFALVKGVVDVMPKDGDIANADGDAFHNTAALMASLKKEGMKFRCQTGNENFDKAWYGQINLLWLVKRNWTERQRNIYQSYCNSGLQEDVAKSLKITQQTVSKTLKGVAATQVQALEKTLQQWAEAEFKK